MSRAANSLLPSMNAPSFDGMDAASGHLTLADALNVYQYGSSLTGQEPIPQSSDRGFSSVIASSSPYASSGEQLNSASSGRNYHGSESTQPYTQSQHQWADQHQGREALYPMGSQSMGLLDPGFQDAIREADYSNPQPVTPLSYLYPRGEPSSTARHGGYSQGITSHNFNLGKSITS
ncbi:hypothetical protein CC2G_006318 [Coprinopsis cinerea AmutBmut pab1-1]|nr:hypothetical protein CC2G_006318 [Coprinopsis cinerea AmutBmut pab1-1]